MRLIDFNPIGGTTSPLLFDWDELPYTMPAPSPRSNEPESSSSAAANSTESMANGTGERPTVAASPTRQPGEEEISASAGEATADERAGRVGSHEGSNGSASGDTRALQQGEAASGWPGEIQFRLNRGGAVVRPNVAAYGAPFDMVDNSEGSAISDLLRRLQTEERD